MSSVWSRSIRNLLHCNRRLEEGEKYTESHRRGLSKTSQIRSILETELKDQTSYEGAIFDDDAESLLDVQKEFEGKIKCFYVAESLTRELVDRFIG